MMSTKKKLPAHSRGSSNIFADLGLPNAEEHQLKAALVVQLKQLMVEREMTQTKAAKLVRHVNAGREFCLTAAAGPPKDPFVQASSGVSAVG